MMRIQPILLVDPDMWAVTPLEDAGFTVSHAADATHALRVAKAAGLVLVELDIWEGDGLTFVSELRDRSSVPIFVHTVRPATERTLALKLGADMAVGKPISGSELVARTRIVLRRCERHHEPLADFRNGRLRVDTLGYKVTADGKIIAFTPTEFRLLAALHAHHGEILSRPELASYTWGADYSDEDLWHTVDVHIGRIRQKLGQHGARHLVQTVRGEGFRLFDPEPEDDDDSKGDY